VLTWAEQGRAAAISNAATRRMLRMVVLLFSFEMRAARLP
jgi:hypothetical protein